MEREFKIGRVEARIMSRSDGIVEVQAWLPGKHVFSLVPGDKWHASWVAYPTVSEAIAGIEAKAAEYLAMDATARAREESTIAAIEALIPAPMDVRIIIEEERFRIVNALNGIPRSKDNRVTLKRVLAVVSPD